MDIGERVRLLMDRDGVSLRELSEKFEMNYNLLSNYMSGSRKPSAVFMTKIINFWKDDDLNWIFRGSDQNYVNENGIAYNVPKTPSSCIQIIERELAHLKQLVSHN